MTGCSWRRRVIAASAALLLLQAPLSAGTSLASARDLYAAAAYEEALALLDSLGSGELPATERDAVLLYRALCQFALGRIEPAQQSLDTLILQSPFYRPGDEVPPRLRTAFADSRRRLLPSLLQQLYTRGKAAFDRKEFASAAVTFTQVLSGLDDPDLTAVAGQPPLSDLKTLAAGFQALSEAAIPQPPEPIVAPVPAGRLVYSADDTAVIPPVVIRQDIPVFRGRLSAARVGVLEVIIDATGAVESAKMRVPTEPAYDRLVLTAATQWQYRPALLNGTAVKYIRRVQVTLLPQ